jgi:hypothetical protein
MVTCKASSPPQHAIHGLDVSLRDQLRQPAKWMCEPNLAGPTEQTRKKEIRSDQIGAPAAESAEGMWKWPTNFNTVLFLIRTAYFSIAKIK